MSTPIRALIEPLGGTGVLLVTLIELRMMAPATSMGAVVSAVEDTYGRHRYHAAQHGYEPFTGPHYPELHPHFTQEYDQGNPSALSLDLDGRQVQFKTHQAI